MKRKLVLILSLVFISGYAQGPIKISQGYTSRDAIFDKYTQKWDIDFRLIDNRISNGIKRIQSED